MARVAAGRVAAVATVLLDARRGFAWSLEPEIMAATVRLGDERTAKEAAKVADAQAKAADARRTADLAQLAALRAQYG